MMPNGEQEPDGGGEGSIPKLDVQFFNRDVAELRLVEFLGKHDSWVCVVTGTSERLRNAVKKFLYTRKIEFRKLTQSAFMVNAGTGTISYNTEPVRSPAEALKHVVGTRHKAAWPEEKVDEDEMIVLRTVSRRSKSARNSQVRENQTSPMSRAMKQKAQQQSDGNEWPEAHPTGPSQSKPSHRVYYTGPSLLEGAQLKEEELYQRALLMSKKDLQSIKEEERLLQQVLEASREQLENGESSFNTATAASLKDPTPSPAPPSVTTMAAALGDPIPPLTASSVPPRKGFFRRLTVWRKFKKGTR